MAIDFTDSTGNLFNRLGQIFGAIEDIETYQGTTLDNAISTVDGQYNDDPDLISGLQSEFTRSRSAAGRIKSSLVRHAERTLIEMVDDDNALPSKTLRDALEELIDQMDSGSESVDANAVGSSDSAASGNNGDGELVSSVTDGEGDTMENVLAEDIVVECVSDSQPGTGNLTKGSESFEARGEAGVNPLAYDWPKGSGASVRITAANPTQDDASNNFLTNSDFEAFTSNDPDNWTIQAGSAGSTILEEASTVYEGSAALEFAGDGSTNPKITQELRNVSGSNSTEGRLRPETRYAIGVRINVSSSPAAGVLSIALKDGTGGGASTIGTALTIDLTGESAGWTFHSGQLNTAASLPDTIYAVVETTTAISDTVNVFIDHLAIVPMTQVYDDGPLIAIFSGATKFLVEDLFTVTVTNDRAGKFQEFFQRAFAMRAKGLQLPSAGSPTIADSLIS